MARSEKASPRTYLQRINQLLRPHSTRAPISAVDLFSGCGGLGLGFEASGFLTTGYDKAADAVRTYESNLIGRASQVILDDAFMCPAAPVIIGGPPCQPFSEIGLRRGKLDGRDGFPAFIRSVNAVRPEIWLFENVPGLLRQRAYFDEIVGKLKGLGYKVDLQILDAAAFGVPQRRQRLVVVGWKKGEFVWPKPTLPPAKVRCAIGRTMIKAFDDSRFLTRSMEDYIAKYEAASKCINPRDLVPDRPARTVTCRNLGGATGDMLRVKLPDGRRRRLMLREAARLQSFPDWFEFTGSEASCFDQVGNAVPPLLSLHLGDSIYRFLS